MKKIKRKIIKEFKVFIMKFLTEHNKQVILEIINYSVSTTHFLLHPQQGKQLTLFLGHLQFLQSTFLQEQT